ncbi:MAG TPA: rRNA maturation RNase YbeY [Clostridiaceae bacterium]|nr:rRNA maturation RNase YbeY [Clostridiaceae bacterium]
MIHIENEQEQVMVEVSLLDTIEESITYAIKSQGLTMEAEVSVLLVDNEAIREINKEHRQKDQETDVLSFPMIDFPEGETFKDTAKERVFGPAYYHGEALLLGDVVLSMEKAEAQAKEFGHSLRREVAYLVVHSILHLLGYDHMNPEDQKKMRHEEEEILQALKIQRI